jgi:hypothetical protein
METGEPGFHNYTTLEGCVLDGIRSLNIFSMPCWSYKTLDITLYNTINWPCDCIKPLITTLKRDGHHYLLEISEDLFETLVPNPTPTIPDANEAVHPPEDFFQLDGFIQAYGWGVWSWGLGELYGAGTLLPPFGIVVPDKKNRQSFIKRVQLKTGDQCGCFYKSDGLEDIPEFFPSEAKETLEFFSLQKYFRVRNPGLSDDMRLKYKEHLFQLERFYQDGDEQQWTRSMYSNVKSSPKL